MKITKQQAQKFSDMFSKELGRLLAVYPDMEVTAEDELARIVVRVADILEDESEDFDREEFYNACGDAI